MKIVAIVTARMNSTRLPGKVLLNLAGKPVLWWIAARIAYSSEVNEIIIATTKNKANDPIANNHYLPFGCHVYRYNGEEDDVIERVIACAEYANADIIVDITGDCPIVDPAHIDNILRYIKLTNHDYVSNCIERTWPDGLDIQAYKLSALKKVKEKFNPEFHTGWNIAQHPELFKIHNIIAPMVMHWPELGLTLDEKEDYELLEIIFNEFGKNISFPVEDVINYLKENPELLKINKNIKRKSPEKG